MDEDRENEIYSDQDFADFLEMVERREASEARPPRHPEGQDRPRSGKAASDSRARRSAQRQPAGRHAAPAPSKPAKPPKQPKRRLTPKQRRLRRRMTSLLVLALIAGAVYVGVNITVSRVKDFTVSAAAVDRQVLSWQGVKGVDGYDIYDGSGALLAQVDAGGETEYTVDGLQSGKQYTYTISAVKNFLGEHAGKPVECSAYTLPEAVSAVTALNSGTGALLNWEDSGDGSYEVQYTDSSGAATTVETHKSGAEGVSISGLQEGAQYTFQVRSFVQDGESRIYSDWSSSQPITAMNTVDMTGVDIDKPMVALTFDDGPDYEDITERILKTLKEYDAHASFFQQGASAADNPEKMAQILEAGHEIASHTYNHMHYGSDVTADDIISADDAIEQACGKRPTAFRSPGGETTDLIRQTCAYEGIPIFYWSIDTEDWKSRNADAVCDAVMNYVSDGDIILMHNTYSSTADAVERIVPFLAKEGYQMVTVTQLVLAKTGQPPVPGLQYVTATITN